jgi:hypothetical protein
MIVPSLPKSKDVDMMINIQMIFLERMEIFKNTVLDKVSIAKAAEVKKDLEQLDKNAIAVMKKLIGVKDKVDLW